MTIKKYFVGNIKWLRVLLAVIFSALFQPVASQSDLFNVNVVVKPPVSSVFSEYGNLSNKVIITIQNLQNRAIDHIAFHGRLVKTSDEFITTRYEYAPPVFMSFNPLETKTIMVDPVQLRFLRKEVVESSFTGLMEEVLKTNLLPEGNWSLCVQAFLFINSTIQPVSNEACFPLNITRANPPVITSPFNNHTIPSLQPNIVFAWTPPAGNIIGAQVVYDLYAVKVLPGQAPNDAMNAAVMYKANNPLIKTNLTGNQYVTQPFDLKLDTGATYAVQVVARDLNRQVAFQNNGRSEVVVFNYGEQKQPGFNTVVAQPKQKPGGDYTVTNIDPVPFSQIKGKLYYRFKDGTTSPSTQGAVNTPQLSVAKPAGGLKDDNIGYNKDNTPLSDSKPLSGKKISLIISYLFSGDINGKSVSEAPLEKNSMAMGKFNQEISQVADKVLATTTTSGDGSFSFNFANLENELGLIDNNVNILEGPVEFRTSIKGKLFKVLRVRVEDKYYCSPDVNIKVDPWKGVDLGTIVSYVKSYTLKVKVTTIDAPFWDMAQGQGTPLPGISTRILRKGNIPVSVPSNEAGSKSNMFSLPNGEHLKATAESDKNGFVTFRHLVQHNPDNKADKYYIKCTPQQTGGNFTFKETEKSYYPLYNKDLTGFPFNDQREYKPVSSNPDDIIFPVIYGEDITWNHQLVVQTYTETIQLYPGKPRIAGTVKVGENIEAKPMSNVKVVMMNQYQKGTDPSKFLTVVKTNSSGQYQFNDLPVELDNFNPNGVTSVIGPTRSLITKPDGFKAAELPGSKASDSIWKKMSNTKKICAGCYPPLKWGQQLLNQDFFLTPDGRLAGYVEDEEGNAVYANINIDGYTTTDTKLFFYYENTQNAPSQGQGLKLAIPSGVRQQFSVAAPSGQRKVTITPDNNDYAIKDTTITIQKDSKNATPIRFVVIAKQKRIRFQVVESTGKGRLSLPGKPIPGAKVKMEGMVDPMTRTADNNGYVTFIFKSSSSNFEFTITPPENADYEEGFYQVNGAEDVLQTVTYAPARLKKSATISGTVTIGPDKKPLENASVYVDMGNGKQLASKTDKSGKYILKRVPATPAEVTVYAGKSNVVPTIISQHKKINISVGKENTMDFNLYDDNEIAIGKIFGFDAEITGKSDKQSDNTWLISGNLKINGNDNFNLQNDNQTIPFQDLKIKKTGKLINGISEGVPATDVMTTDLTFIKLFLQHAFAATQYPATGDRLQLKGGDQEGSLTGKVFIKKSSFKFSEQQLKLNDDTENALVLTEKPGSSETNIPTIKSGAYAKSKFGVAGLDEKAMKFRLLGFDASANFANSWIQDNTLSIQTVIHINGLPGMSPSAISVDAGDLVVHPDKFEPLKSDQPLKFKLENWQFEGDNWQLMQNTGGISIPSGTMLTGSLNIPLKNISIKPNHLSIGGFDVANLTMANVIPVEVLTKKPIFGYNPSIGKDQKAHYEMRLIGEEGQPGVQIKSLPGMKPGDAFRFQNFSLISNGEQILNPGNQSNNIKLYSVMKVRPLAFTSGAGYVEMDCGIDLGIPQLQETSGILHFTKESGKIKMDVRPLNVSLEGPGFVHFTPNVKFDDKPQNLTEGHFTAMGTITDKEGIKLKSVLHRTVQSAWVQVDPENQILPLGSNNTKLANIKGKMEADMASYTWKNFVFSGEMQGFTGMQGDTRKTFTVTGSINASNEKVEVKNIPSGFGSIGITYDIANSRFLGNLQLDKAIGPLHITGVADFLADAGGWYFLAGGKLQTPGFGEMSAGLLIGDYHSMPGNVSHKLMQFAYDKHVPPSFKNGISGFFFTGMKDLPVINIPDYSIDLGVISASFGAKAGVDGRLWMDFGSAGNEYGIGAMVFAHAYLKGASITCTKFGAEARAEMGMKGKYTTSTGAFSLAGCGSFNITGSIQQCFPTPCISDGICCTGCIGISKTTGIKIDILLDSKGNTDLSFGFGNCSGQAVMTGNW
ncbi:MAG: carboxypeptidase regulatory-like domain-containing protein [Chitinophagaceae bacterium]|nr:carboxypeptidase regulatory-like domain-containing protein [Chitinophagaceae bacterium]MCW5925328.1 carboxypeptidase regulatory-like domain-containing protein [Chitinophagaceae bacterium]